MLTKIMAAAAVSALAITGAMAQATNPPAGSAPAATATPATPAPTASAKPAGKAEFVAKQDLNHWLASKFTGTDVIGTDEAKIGDVSDILFDKDKKVVAYIIGVGGFLGIGQKDVAIDPASFQFVAGKDASDFKLRLSMTKDELKNAPAFEAYAPPRPATTSQAPANRPMAPAPATPPAQKQ